jgi:hypothetical protein
LSLGARFFLKDLRPAAEYYAHMARYYFSLENGHPLGDPLGEELPDDQAARAAAEKIATDLARNNLNLGSLRIVVRNRENRRVGEVSVMAPQFAKKSA